jgi:hypothetical protein
VLNYRATIAAYTQRDQTLISSKRRPHFQEQKWSSKKHNFGQVFRRGAKPRTAVLAKASNNILDRSELTTYKDWKAEESGFESQ